MLVKVRQGQLSRGSEAIQSQLEGQGQSNLKGKDSSHPFQMEGWLPNGKGRGSPFSMARWQGQGPSIPNGKGKSQWQGRGAMATHSKGKGKVQSKHNDNGNPLID